MFIFTTKTSSNLFCHNQMSSMVLDLECVSSSNDSSDRLPVSVTVKPLSTCEWGRVRCEPWLYNSNKHVIFVRYLTTYKTFPQSLVLFNRPSGVVRG